MGERLTGLETGSLTIRGVRSQLRLDDGVITISREGDTVTAPSEVSFEVGRVRGARFESPPRGGRGWLHVAVVGGSPAPPSELAAVNDPYTLPLSPRGAGAAKRLERLIEKHIKVRGKPTDPVARPGGPSSRVSVSSGLTVVPADTRPPSSSMDAAPEVEVAGSELVAALRELGELHASGVLSTEEFRAAKARLLT